MIIKEYLLQLKEKDELDLLLCDILLQQGYITDNVPKTGNRQYGVDIRAHRGKEILLCVVKQGDLNRRNWDSGPNAVRQSLNDIHDGYLNFIKGKDREKKLRIVVATNGMMDEALRPNWDGYVNKNTQWDGMNVEIAFWNIDQLTDFVQKNLFQEQIFDSEMQRLLRRALYYIDVGDYQKQYFEQIIDMFLSQLNDSNSRKVIKKQLSAVFLASQMIAQYAADAGIFKIGIMVSEYLIIRIWKYLLGNDKFEKRLYVDRLHTYLAAYEKWNRKYFGAVQCYCVSKICPPFNNPVEQRVMLYEVLGYLTSYAYYLSYKGENDDTARNECDNIITSIIQLINSHPQFLYPAYDNNIGVVSMLYRLLDRLGRYSDICVLMKNQCETLAYFYLSFRKYPTSSDSFEDAINIQLGLPSEDYSTSGFWGTMLEWIVLMDQKELYESIQPFLSEDLADVTKCTWFLCSNEEKSLYDPHAMNLAGDGVAYDAEKTFEKMKETVDYVMKQYEREDFSFDTYSFEALEFIISRYYGYLPRVKRETNIMVFE